MCCWMQLLHLSIIICTTIFIPDTWILVVLASSSTTSFITMQPNKLKYTRWDAYYLYDITRRNKINITNKRRRSIIQSTNNRIAYKEEEMEQGSSTRSSNTNAMKVAVEEANTSNSSNGNMNTTSLYDLLSPKDNCAIEQMSPAALAYIGDVVFELFARSRYVWPNRKMSSLQDIVVNIVRAEMQSNILQRMFSSEHLNLSQKEKQILIRGRNSADGRRGGMYQDATALEALIGYTYIGTPQRCTEILLWISQHILDEIDNNGETKIIKK